MFVCIFIGKHELHLHCGGSQTKKKTQRGRKKPVIFFSMLSIIFFFRSYAIHVRSEVESNKNDFFFRSFWHFHAISNGLYDVKSTISERFTDITGRTYSIVLSLN